MQTSSVKSYNSLLALRIKRARVSHTELELSDLKRLNEAGNRREVRRNIELGCNRSPTALYIHERRCTISCFPWLSFVEFAAD